MGRAKVPLFFRPLARTWRKAGYGRLRINQIPHAVFAREFAAGAALVRGDFFCAAEGGEGLLVISLLFVEHGEVAPGVDEGRVELYHFAEGGDGVGGISGAHAELAARVGVGDQLGFVDARQVGLNCALGACGCSGRISGDCRGEARESFGAFGLGDLHGGAGRGMNAATGKGENPTKDR